MSFDSIHFKLGTAYTAGKKGKPVFFLKVPKTCPAGGFKLKSEATFAEGGEESMPVNVSSAYSAACPNRPGAARLSRMLRPAAARR